MSKKVILSEQQLKNIILYQNAINEGKIAKLAGMLGLGAATMLGAQSCEPFGFLNEPTNYQNTTGSNKTQTNTDDAIGPMITCKVVGKKVQEYEHHCSGKITIQHIKIIVGEYIGDTVIVKRDGGDKIYPGDRLYMEVEDSDYESQEIGVTRSSRYWRVAPDYFDLYDLDVE